MLRDEEDTDAPCTAANTGIPLFTDAFDGAGKRDYRGAASLCTQTLIGVHRALEECGGGECAGTIPVFREQATSASVTAWRA